MNHFRPTRCPPTVVRRLPLQTLAEVFGMEKQLSAGLLQVQDMGYTPMMSVTCPPGFAPGAAFVVQDPSTGQQMQVVVPDGIAPGQTFQVQVPFRPQRPCPWHSSSTRSSTRRSRWPRSRSTLT